MQRRVGSWDILFGEQLIDQRLQFCLNCCVLCVPRPPRGYSSGAIRLHIPHVPKTTLRLPIRKIRRKRNTIVTGSQSKVNAMTQPTQPTQTSHRSSYLTVIFLAFRKRRAVNKKDGRNTILCRTELKAGIMVENISGLNCKTITRVGC